MKLWSKPNLMFQSLKKWNLFLITLNNHLKTKKRI